MKNFIFSTLLIFGGLFVGLFVGELLLRTFYPVYRADAPELMIYDEAAGYTYDRGLREKILKDYQVEIHTNQAGAFNFWDDFDRYDQVIFAVGDSYTQGTGLPADASYPSQLNLQINLQGDGFSQKFGIVNLGVDGYGVLQAIERMKMFAEKYGKPDLVLFLGCDNDFEGDNLFEQGQPFKKIVNNSPRWGSLVGPLRWVLQLQVVVHTKRVLHSLRSASPAAEKKDYASLQKERLNLLKEEVDKLGAELIISWVDWESPSYEGLREWSNEQDVEFADWQPSAQQVTQAMPDLPMENEHSGGHYRTWVNTIIAHTFRDEIMQKSMPEGQTD